MKEEIERFYFTEYNDVDEFVKELSSYIEDLLGAQKKQLLEKIENKKAEQEKEFTKEEWIGYCYAVEDIKKLLINKEL